MVNILGPGHTALTNEVTSRPTQDAPVQTTKAWFAQCPDGNPAGGTKLDALFLNSLIANLRNPIETSGATQDATVDDMLSEAIARYASLSFGTGGGTANAQTVAALTGIVVPKALFDGMVVEWVPSATNTGATTLAAWGLAAKNVKDSSGNALNGGEIISGQIAKVRYVLASDEFRLHRSHMRRKYYGDTNVNSGTAVDFTNLPAGLRRVGILINGLSTNGSVGSPMVQMRVGGAAVTTGYAGGWGFSAATNLSSSGSTTAGIIIPNNAAAAVLYGAIMFERYSPLTNEWMAWGMVIDTGSRFSSFAVYKALAGELDGIRFTTTNGTDAYDGSGKVNLYWE